MKPKNFPGRKNRRKTKNGKFNIPTIYDMQFKIGKNNRNPDGTTKTHQLSP